MARQYAKQKRGQMLTIHGFSEMIEILNELEKRGVDASAEKIFDECTDIVKSSFDKYTAQSGIPADLVAKRTQFKVKHGNTFMYADGWDRNKNLEDFLKVCYLNYGTPRRTTAKGYNRGKVEARGFISNAKRSAAQKINARKKSMLKELLEGANK